MNQGRYSLLEYSTSEILPSQYDDLVRRRSGGFEAERRLLWAVLENAIHVYLANIACATAKQRDEFEEICTWLQPSAKQPCQLFSFETICELLEIDACQLRGGLESIHVMGTSTGQISLQTLRSALRLGRIAAGSSIPQTLSRSSKEGF
jgi:hypothetical protein